MDLALERLTLSYNEMLRVENTGRDRKKLKTAILHFRIIPQAPYETEDGCLSLLCVRKTIDDV